MTGIDLDDVHVYGGLLILAAGAAIANHPGVGLIVLGLGLAGLGLLYSWSASKRPEPEQPVREAAPEPASDEEA